MKQEQLKKLADWLCEDELYTPFSKCPVWCMPQKDSNQLDMMEDKMIEELSNYELCKNLSGGFRLDIIIYIGNNTTLIQYMPSNRHSVFIEGVGKTKNKARLNAILNYVERLK